MAQKFVVQPPPAFQVNQAQLGRAWKNWKQLFLIYLDASDYEEATDRKKVSLLLHAIGTDGIELYNNFSFPPTPSNEEGEVTGPTFAQVLKKFDDHFQSGVNVHFERYLFLTRDQAPGETVDQYATALRTLASTCQLADITDSLVLSRLICGLSNRSVKERLLRTRGLELPTVIDACRAAEAAKDQLRVIDKEPEERIESVRIKPTTTVNRVTGQVSAAKDKDKCSRCGYLHGLRRCPANGKSCHNCKGAGHFASMCRSRKASVQDVQADEVVDGISVVNAVPVEHGLDPASDVLRLGGD